MGYSNKERAAAIAEQQMMGGVEELVRKAILEILPEMVEKGMTKQSLEVRVLVDIVRVLIDKNNK